MKLANVMAMLTPDYDKEMGDIDVIGLSMDSRKVKVGYGFIALQGENSHGNDYIDTAIKNGASVIFSDCVVNDVMQKVIIDASVKLIVIDDLKHKIKNLVEIFYQPVFKQLKNIYAVTGTNGKTTVSQLLAQALSLLNEKTATLGTAGNGFFGSLDKSELTTMDVFSTCQAITDYQKQGAESLAMEASSHGLMQGRLSGLPISTAILTNITQDHLDYHSTIEEYKNAKKRLFAEFQLGCSVINMDSEFSSEFMEAAKSNSGKTLTYSCTKSDADIALIGASNAMDSSNNKSTNSIGTDIECTVANQTIAFRSQLIGHFNVENALAVITALYGNGHRLDDIADVMAKLQPVAGRMQIISPKDKAENEIPTVIVDFAHTPDALANVLSSLNQFKQNKAAGRLIVVFGCGGNRDKLKRPLMGDVAVKGADCVIVTSDNPRHEAADAIIQDITANIKESVTVIENRREAIHHAINNAKPEDIVLIAGKGHETGQIIGDETLPFDDAVIAEMALGRYQA